MFCGKELQDDVIGESSFEVCDFECYVLIKST